MAQGSDLWAAVRACWPFGLENEIFDLKRRGLMTTGPPVQNFSFHLTHSSCSVVGGERERGVRAAE